MKKTQILLIISRLDCLPSAKKMPIIMTDDSRDTVIRVNMKPPNSFDGIYVREIGKIVELFGDRV